MGSTPVRRRRPPPRRRWPWVAAAIVAAVVLGLGAAVLWWSGATLGGDPVALARIEVQPLGGSLVSARAFARGGTPIPISENDGRLVPRTLVAPGEVVTVVVVVRRPSWLGWALGHNRTERLTVSAPVARLTQRWLTVASHSPVRLTFAAAVDRVDVALGGRRRTVSAGGRVLSLGAQAPLGTVEVSSAARSWERLGDPVRVTWFPASRLPVVLVSPGNGTPISPRDPVRLTFSRPVQDAIGKAQPRFSSGVPGDWRATDTHTLVFTPTGFGFPLAADVHLQLPRTLDVSSGGSAVHPGSTVEWQVAGASFLRLQQLLATEGYLPVGWQPAGAPVSMQPLAEVSAAVDPPAGTFSWLYPNTPPELQRQWTVGQPSQITRGAVMMFEHDHGFAVDGIAGAQVWHALLTDAIAGKTRTDGYSYVYVHRNVPQLLTLWHNGHIVITSPGNTGVPAAPTQLGTYPVFEHIPVGTMSGTNPDGSHYHAPGIRWISYFHGGDALHSFNRASFGTPQSLGCVELPLATAAKVWPYTPIGTLVTIEN